MPWPDRDGIPALTGERFVAGSAPRVDERKGADETLWRTRWMAGTGGMAEVALIGEDLAALSRRREVLAAQAVATECLTAGALASIGEGGVPGVAVIDDAGLDPAALDAAIAALSGRGALVLVLFRLPRGVSYRLRHEQLTALGAADVMEAPGTEEDFVTRVRALLIRRQPARVLVVEDDATILAWVSDILTGAGMEAIGAASLAEGRAAFEAGRIDALVVDRMLPDGDGLDFVARIRRHGIRTPALLFTAMGELGERIRGLGEARADDYICKPVHAEELLVRVEVLLRPRGDEELLVFGPLGINRRDRLIRWRGALVPLRAKEAEMLIYLAERSGLSIPQRMLFVDVWHKLFMEPSSNPVAAAKHRLVASFRAFLKERGETCPDFIVTEGDAYSFVPDALLRLPPDADDE